MAREKNLDNKVIKLIEENNWCIKYWAGAKYTKKGIPDILACINGYFFGIEDKADRGKPTILQLKNLQWIREAGGYGILLYPDDFNQFKKFINNINKNNSWYISNIELQNKWIEKLMEV